MPVPDYQTLMLPLLRHAAQGETRVPEVADKLAVDDRRPTVGFAVKRAHGIAEVAVEFPPRDWLRQLRGNLRFVAQCEDEPSLT